MVVLLLSMILITGVGYAAETGNILKSLNLKTEEVKEYTNYIKRGETLTLIAYDHNVLFYTKFFSFAF